MLTDLDTVRSFLANKTAPSSDQELAGYAQMASAAFETETRRTILATDYDLQFAGQDDHTWLLPQFPLLKVYRLQFLRVAVVYFTFTLSPASEAGVYLDVDEGTVTLSSTVNAVQATPVTLKFTDYPTVADLAAAVNGVTNWSATAINGYDSYPCSEFVDSGYRSALGQAALELYGTDQPYRVTKADIGEVFSIYGFRRGLLPHRIRFRAGYECPPDDIKSCVGEIAALLWQQRGVNPHLTQLTHGPSNVGVLSQRTREQLSWVNQKVIQYYKNPTVTDWRL
jgi:hypothetical protein